MMRGCDDKISLVKLARTDARRAERRAYSADRLEGKRRDERRRPPPILRGDRRKHVVRVVLDKMKDWRLSPFEAEGPMRSSLRSAFCLEGFSWDRSDKEAVAIVADALRLMGAKRPSWEQGQPEYTIPAENCSWCSREMDVVLTVASRRYRFCSGECATAASKWRDAERVRHESQMHIAALEMIRKRRKPPRTCAHCHGAFHSENPKAIYCGTACYNAGRTIYQRQERKCRCCGRAFTPRDPNAVYCSKRCYRKHYYRPTLHCVCETCSREFLAAFETTRYCSASCRTQKQMLETGKWKPKRISPVVFDHFITKPVNAAPRRLTPQSFDWMMMGIGMTLTAEVVV